MEPVKGSQFPVRSTTQDKIVSPQSVHPEIGLPDLSVSLHRCRMPQMKLRASDSVLRMTAGTENKWSYDTF